LPKAAHVDLDEVRERIEAVIPDVFRDLGARHDPTSIEKEKFEERVFLRGQLDRPSADLDQPLSPVELDAADGERDDGG
jgi:hypothetical protein